MSSFQLNLSFPGAIRRAALLFSLTLACGSTLAQTAFDEEFDDQEKPWQEIALQLPAAPQDQNLAEFYLSATATMKAFVDLKSVSIGTDKVVRYTVVTKTQGGAVNVVYEGMRCETWEKKSYAFGHPDGKWSRSRRDQWQRIKDVSANRIDAALFRDYLCEGTLLADNGDLRSILDRLKNQRPIDPVRR